MTCRPERCSLNDGDNLLTNIPDDLPAELVQVLLDSPQVRIERIISRGHASPAGFWYDQPEDEWVLVVQGAARLQFEDGTTRELVAGDYVNLPARLKHRVAWTRPDEPTVWLAVRYGPALANSASGQ